MVSFKEYDPSKQIPDLSGKTIIVTGGTAGLGAEMALQLAAHNPLRLYITGRNQKTADEVIKKARDACADANATQISFLPCDLASLAAVRDAARQFLSDNDRLDILFCNAGIMAMPPALTSDGYELQFGTNHLGHALLIKLLMPALLHTASQSKDKDARIILTSSLGFQGAQTIPFSAMRTTQKKTVDFAGRWIRYAQSKLANILYAQQLAVNYPTITSAAVHPGIITTGLVNNTAFADRALVHMTTFWRQSTVQDGAKNALWAGTIAKNEVKNGEFYEPVGNVGCTTKASKDQELSKELWDWTEKELETWKL